MDILKVIKERKTIRKYKDKPIPKEIIEKIIEAGRWGPSLMGPGFQPWKFIIIEDKKIISSISNLLSSKAKESGIGINTILRGSSNVISNSRIIILVYSTAPLSRWVGKIYEYYENFAKLAELAAISAAIQNMILTAHSCNIGSCWLDAPLFCEKEINELIKKDDKLIAVLTLGYSCEKGVRAKRKILSEIVEYIR